MIIDAFSCPFALWCVCASVLLCCALFFFAGNFFAPSAERQEEDHTRADNAHLVKENADVKLPRVEGHEDCVQTVRGASAPPIIVQQTKKGQPPKPGLAFPTTHNTHTHSTTGAISLPVVLTLSLGVLFQKVCESVLCIRCEQRRQ